MSVMASLGLLFLSFFRIGLFGFGGGLLLGALCLSLGLFLGGLFLVDALVLRHKVCALLIYAVGLEGASAAALEHGLAAGGAEVLGGHIPGDKAAVSPSLAGVEHIALFGSAL